MRIGIIGSGALGLYYGALLQRSGQDVRFLLRRDFDAIRGNGLQVYSINGDFHLPQVAGFRTSDEIGPVDLVLVGLKTFANHRLVELVAPLMKKDTAILTLQNGLGNEELLAEAFGSERVLGGIAFLCSNRRKSGSVHHLGEGWIRIGEYNRPSGERTRILEALFKQAGIPCTAVDDLRRARWEKLVWNIPFNGLAALLKQDVTELLSYPPNLELVRELMLEVVAAANSQQLLEPIDGLALSDKMIGFTQQMDHYRPSMLVDRMEHRPLELEAIYARPLSQAAKADIAMPRVAMLHALLGAGEVREQ